VSDIQPTNEDLVFVDDTGEPLTTSLVIAEQTDNEHASVMRLVRDNLDDLNEIGLVRFEIRPRPEGQHGGGDVQYATLDEPAATLLMTYLRNTAVVKDFKKRLVRGFYAMRQLLAERAAQVELPGRKQLAQMVIEAEEAREVAERQLAIESKARRAMESYAKDLEPRAEFYDRFMDADGTFSVGAVAKMLGASQNKLYDELRNAEVMIAKGCMRNTPYQRYMHHFAVKAYEYERHDGARGTSYTTRVQPSGVEFIARKVGRSVKVPS